MDLNDEDANDGKRQKDAGSRNILLNTSKLSLEKLLGWRSLILADVRSIYHTVTSLTAIIDIDFVSAQELRGGILAKHVMYTEEQINAALVRYYGFGAL